MPSLTGFAKKIILSLLTRAGYSLVKLSDVQETTSSEFSVGTNLDTTSLERWTDHDIAGALRRRELIVTPENWPSVRSVFEALPRSPKSEAPLLSAAGKCLFDAYFSFDDKLGEEAISVARQSIVLFEAALRLSPYRFDDYRSIWTLLYYVDAKEKSYDVMAVMAAHQRTMASVFGFDRFKRRFVSPNVITNIGVTTHIEVYLKAMNLGLIEKTDLFLLMHEYLPANGCLLEYFGKHIHVISQNDMSEELAIMEPYLLDDLHWAIPLNGIPTPFSRAAGDIRCLWEKEGRGPLLTLDPDHSKKGAATLSELGVPADAWFVGMHVRESGKKDDLYRDVRIETYADAIQEIVDRGGWVVRMGDETMTPLPAQKNVVDYAHCSQRSDWMDIYIIAKSRFFISTGSGPGGVPYSFGVPNLLTNYMPIATIASAPSDMVLPKMVASNSENRVLNFAEMLSAPLADCYFQHEFDKLGIRAIDNTPEELRYAVIEMMSRIEQTAFYTEEDEALQQRFWNLSATSRTATGTRVYSRVPQQFLRTYAKFLT